MMPEGQTTWWSRLIDLRRFFVVQTVLMVLAGTALRLVLLIHFGAEGASGTDIIRALVTGLYLDVCIAGFASLPFITLLSVTPVRWAANRFFRFLIWSALLFFWVLFLFNKASEYFFFEEFLSRYNTVAIDYLLYPHEVFTNIWEAYPVVWVIIGTVVAGLVAVMILRRWTRVDPSVPPMENRRRFLGLVMLAVFAMLATTPLVSTRFSRERQVNELANNGTVSVLTAAWSRNLDYSAFYPVVDLKVAEEHTRGLLKETNVTFVSTNEPLRRKVAGDPAKPQLNVVMLLEESLGSEFWGSLGRTNETMMPRMDALSLGEGMLFDNVYATGNRTVRGFEGVLASFPPLPGDSIVKRDRSQNVETIARVLKRDGYQTAFLYGGRGLFDGMRSFSVNNGYERFIEQKDFEKPVFTTVWGVSNEDLYTRTIEECRDMARKGKPFLATVLSVSNHKPFTYPAGRIAEDPNQRRRENAVKYTDWALGEFFAAAKKEDFWKNTIFVVIADHGARVYGSQTIPIRSYEVPFVVFGPAVVSKA
ncbi:MAG TPA: sulfatase-like hydrolase/transferase, partial [Roseimicrobium sp.]|nr:sulfatase-like hydrolase/transferase [Roseimicrobium sp.]